MIQSKPYVIESFYLKRQTNNRRYAPIWCLHRQITVVIVMHRETEQAGYGLVWNGISHQ